MSDQNILRRIAFGREFVFDPSDIFAKYSLQDQVYLRNYIKAMRYGLETFSLVMNMGEAPNNDLRKNLQFRMDHFKDLYELQMRFAKYFFADDNFMDKLGIERSAISNPYTISKIPQTYPPQRLQPSISVPFTKELREEIINTPKKALFPTTTVKRERLGVQYSETWLVGYVKGKLALFRCYEEKRDGITGGFINANSGIGLEIYIKGVALGGKYITRADFKPLKKHPNFIEDNKLVEYAHKPASEIKYINVEPDHTHQFGLEYDLVLPNRRSTDIKINPVQAKRFSEFKENFFKLNNMDMTPILESIEGKENESVVKIVKDYFDDLNKTDSEKEKNEQFVVNANEIRQGGII